MEKTKKNKEGEVLGLEDGTGAYKAAKEQLDTLKDSLKGWDEALKDYKSVHRQAEDGENSCERLVQYVGRRHG